MSTQPCDADLEPVDLTDLPDGDQRDLPDVGVDDPEEGA